MTDEPHLITVESYIANPHHRRFADAILADNGLTTDRCRRIERRRGEYYAELFDLDESGRPYARDDEPATRWVPLPIRTPSPTTEADT